MTPRTSSALPVRYTVKVRCRKFWMPLLWWDKNLQKVMKCRNQTLARPQGYVHQTGRFPPALKGWTVLVPGAAGIAVSCANEMAIFLNYCPVLLEYIQLGKASRKKNGPSHCTWNSYFLQPLDKDSPSLRAGETGRLVHHTLGVWGESLIATLSWLFEGFVHHSNGIQNFRHLHFSQWYRNGWGRRSSRSHRRLGCLVSVVKTFCIIALPLPWHIRAMKASPFTQVVFSSNK